MVEVIFRRVIGGSCEDIFFAMDEAHSGVVEAIE